MKIAPVSADLLIKLALGAAVLGGLFFGYKKMTATLSHAFDSVTGLPARVYDNAIVAAKEGGATWQDRTNPNPPDQQAVFGTYKGPLINNDGYDFGQLSG